MTIHIIHLDDDIQMLERFERIIGNELLGQKVELTQFESTSALEKSFQKSTKVDAFVLDVHLQSDLEDGIRIASLCRENFPQAVILMCSSSKNIGTISKSLRLGANDFMSKDAHPDELRRRLEFAIMSRKESLETLPKIESSVGATMASISIRIPQLIKSAVNSVYIQGESGTGKEVVAGIIESSLPAGTPFIKVNCGAIAPSLIASELFGHVRGAFTGALSDKPGLLEAANGGWIFLDEIATLPMDAQVSLLRAIDNQSIRRVGSTKEKSVNFRVVSATNEPLSELVDDKRFRRDLWQRLRETQIDLPPLRQRRHEIPELVLNFCEIMRGGPYHLAPTVLEALCQYSWKEGNIRELRNCLRAMTEKSVDRILTPGSIPDYIWKGIEDPPSPRSTAMGAHDPARSITITWQSDAMPNFNSLSHQLFLELLRREFITTGRMSIRSAAKALGIPKSSMAAKLEQLVEQGSISKDELNEMIRLTPTTISGVK